MPREISITKRAKISQAQQYTILAVLGAGLFLGAAISLVRHFVTQISFNANVISEADKSIVAYSNAIKNVGICKKPAGDTYTDDELKACNPDSVSVSSVSGSLRYQIMENMSANESLSSVPNQNIAGCINPATGKAYTYVEMQDIYDAAETNEALVNATELIQSCSALRVIPDALPAFKNEEALLSSLNKLFIISNWEPESLSPTETFSTAGFGTNLNTFAVRLSVEADAATTRLVLNNIERSIRDFDIQRATIEWGSNNSLVLQAQANAFYMTPTTLNESSKTIRVGGTR